MSPWTTKYSRSAKAFYCLDMNVSEVLSTITIDDFQFRVTLHPQFDGCCVLWFRDSRVNEFFDALGRFSCFDKRAVLFLIARYTTNPALRREIDNRRFERQVAGWTREHIADIERRSRRHKEDAFRSLFNLDNEVDPDSLARRRRIMARKFHPDVGGDTECMSIINTAYEHLASKVEA